jgi:ribonuclease BN (tRNA processing enzyme)
MDIKSSEDKIIFLGTGGARVMISTQLLASGGIWLSLGDTQILIDPGPGAIVQVNKRKLKPKNLEAILLSHRHLDHSNDTNVMIEAMTMDSPRRRGYFFAPADALGEEPVIYSYLKESLNGIEVLSEGSSYQVGQVRFSTPVRHMHPVETYGFLFEIEKHRFAYIADTRYFDGLSVYRSDLLIMNVVFMETHPTIDHLAIPDVKTLVQDLKPKVAIITHFGMSVFRAHPWEIARELSDETGVKVIAARDGMGFDLNKLDEIP